MPSFVAPHEAEFSLDDDGPVIALTGVSATQPDGWTLLNRPTLVVIDGPGDEGFLLRRLGENGRDAAPEGWDDAVTRRDGALVRFSSGSQLVAQLVVE